MAATHRDTQQASGTTSYVVTKPTGTVDGDLMVAAVLSFGTNGAPAGWTQIRATTITSSFAVTTFWKIAASEGASFTFTGGNPGTAIVSTLAGTVGVTPVDVEAGQANASSTSVTAPGVTTTLADDLLIWVGAGAITSGSVSTISPPSGFTTPTNGSMAGSFRALTLSYLLDQAAIGATGNKVGTIGGSARANAGHLVAFKSAPTALTFNIPLATAAADTNVPTAQAAALSGTLGFTLAPAVMTASALAPIPTLIIARYFALPVMTASAGLIAPTWIGPIIWVEPLGALILSPAVQAMLALSPALTITGILTLSPAVQGILSLAPSGIDGRVLVGAAVSGSIREGY
jgi:hypothetical protein